MWLKILILIAAVAVVIYGFRALSGSRRTQVQRRGDNKPPARDGAVDLVRCTSCGAYTPEGKHCTSCGDLTNG
ncbi:MAG: hypothetical protein P1U65_09730 [Minwuia sp.]|nr:hypothetical protein [Minwuia sp.]